MQVVTHYGYRGCLKKEGVEVGNAKDLQKREQTEKMLVITKADTAVFACRIIQKFIHPHFPERTGKRVRDICMKKIRILIFCAKEATGSLRKRYFAGRSFSVRKAIWERSIDGQANPRKGSTAPALCL